MSNTVSPSISDHFAPVFAKFGYTYRDCLGLAIFCKTFNTALGPKEATFSVQICHARSWETPDLVIQASYHSEGENVLSVLTTILPNVIPANAEELVSRLVTEAEERISTTYLFRWKCAA